MVEVTRENFEELLPEIAQKIRDATFISIDAEYTGIYSDELKSSNSLFDSGEQRYEKSRLSSSKFITCQYGLAIFQKERDSNVYKVDTYNFYLFPVAFESFAKRDLLTCQISCINFLARHNFDFNKFFKQGVPFLNKEKADSLRSYLTANPVFMRTAEYLDLHYFPKKIIPLCEEDIDDIIDRLAGFSKIIDVIHESKKPLVGHNCMTDLLLTYNLFWEALPESYKKFKSCIHNLFPFLYDTKYLARQVHNIRRSIDPDDQILSDSNLFSLYTNTYSVFEMNMPLVDPVGGALKYKDALGKGRRQNLESLPEFNTICHSADFDALVTGCVFLNLCYFASRPKPTADYRKGMPPTFTELLGKTECWRNQVNIARAIITHINLDGPDPEPHRPNWILVKSSDGRHIDPIKLKLELVKYGDLEIDRQNEMEVLIACGAYGCHRKVWQDLKKRGFELNEKCFSSGSILSGKGVRVCIAVAGLGVLTATLVAFFKS